MPKVTIGLTDRDSENADAIQHGMDARSKAHALGIALNLTRYVMDSVLRGAEFTIREGGREKLVVIPELEGRRAAQLAQAGRAQPMSYEAGE